MIKYEINNWILWNKNITCLQRMCSFRHLVVCTSSNCQSKTQQQMLGLSVVYFLFPQQSRPSSVSFYSSPSFVMHTTWTYEPRTFTLAPWQRLTDVLHPAQPLLSVPSSLARPYHMSSTLTHPCHLYVLQSVRLTWPEPYENTFLTRPSNE